MILVAIWYNKFKEKTKHNNGRTTFILQYKAKEVCFKEINHNTHPK